MPPTKPRAQGDVHVRSTPAAQATCAAASARRAFVLRRLHSLSGVVPVGVFLVVHLWTNAFALAGQPAFDAAVGRIHRLPFLPAIEAFGILLPLAFHALYGVKLALEARPNNVRYPSADNWSYTLQRVTGVVALVFIVYHLGELRLATLLGHLRPDAFYPTLSLHLSSTTAGVPWAAIAYLIGVAASVLHFANGLTTFVLSWGVAGSRAAHRRFARTFSLGGVVLFALGAATTIYFATGARPIAAPSAHSSRGIEQSAVVDPALPRPDPPLARDALPSGAVSNQPQRMR